MKVLIGYLKITPRYLHTYTHPLSGTIKRKKKKWKLSVQLMPVSVLVIMITVKNKVEKKQWIQTKCHCALGSWWSFPIAISQNLYFTRSNLTDIFLFSLWRFKSVYVMVRSILSDNGQLRNGVSVSIPCSDRLPKTCFVSESYWSNEETKTIKEVEKCTC